ncbi:hypothetical protein MCEMRE20_01175 [Candidatus Nanopelagicaceae bacterium]
MIFRKITSVLAILTLAGGLALPAGAADIPDEQLTTPRPPVENTGGYSGAYYDDQRTLFRAFTYVEAWGSTNFALSGAVTCDSVLDEPCNSSNYVFFETPLSPCSAAITRDCVISLSGKVGDGALANGSMVETVTANFLAMGTKELKKYANPFKGSASRGIPDSGFASVWKIPGMSHPGGQEFLLIPKLNGEFQDTKGSKPANLDVGLFAVSRVPIAGQSFESCFFATKTDCFIRWAHPKDSTFSVSLKTGAKIIGWFHGRLTAPEISSEKLSDGQTQITIQGATITVPTLAAWAKNSDLPARLDQMIEEEFVQRGNQFAGVAYFGGDAKSRSQQAVMDERNPSFDSNFFERYMLWVEVAKDKAYASVSTWSFRTMQDYQDYAKCIGDSGVAGMVTTNSNAYIAGPPKFRDGDLAYRVASPHFDSKGEVQIGTYDLAIRSDIARCIYGFTSAPIQATLSVVYADGEAKKATTLVSEKNNWLRLSAKGFTYSSPTVKVRLTQEKAIEAATPTPSVSTKPIAAKKTSITCIKGKTTKKVTAVNPKCPTGYKKK